MGTICTIPTPPPLPEDYYGEDSNDLDSEDRQPPPSAAMLKWYNSDEDSYSSHCPKDKNILTRGLQHSNQKENFFRNLQVTQDIPYWAMLKTQVDVQK